MKWAAFMALGTVALGAAAARAENPPIVGAAGSASDEAVLVGRGGEVYARGTDGGWRRRAGGGVAAALVGAFGPTARDIWAIGAAGPPYHHDGSAWNAAVITRGRPALLAGAGSPAVAIADGRRISVRAAAGGEWLALPLTNAPVIAAWAASATDACASTQDGRLWRLAGGAWRPINLAKGTPADPVVVLAGNARTLIAVGRVGSALLVDRGRGRATRLTDEPALGAFVPQLAAVGGTNAFLVGETTTGLTLAKVDRERLVLVEALPPLDVGDQPIALLAGANGSALVATRAGMVLRRAAAGGWTIERVDPGPPPTGGHVFLPPAPLSAP